VIYNQPFPLDGVIGDGLNEFIRKVPLFSLAIDVWQDQYGSSSLSALTLVPEPASLVLLAAYLAVATMRRSR
jgi:hypothetical protein